MLTVYLFCLFLIVYAYLFVPARSAVVTVAVEPVEVAPVLPASAAKEMPSTIADLTITPAELAEMEQDATVTDYGRMGCVELRRECSANGIKWRVRRNKGKGKGTYYHLSVSEMREALARL